MNRIDQKFADLKVKHQTALIGFITAGDPDLETSRTCILEMENNGCDIIEIGIPFSDPCAEGPIIQAASERALQNNLHTDDVMKMVASIRQESQIPLIFLLYYNQIYKYGSEAFMQACADCGIDGLIIPDLPYEHQEELRPIAEQHGIYLISLVAPVSVQRKAKIAKNSKGFLYCVTSMGDSDMQDTFTNHLQTFIAELNSECDTPKALHLIIDHPKQIQFIKAFVDGIIIDSAIVKEIHKYSTGEITLKEFGTYIAALAMACHM